MLTTDALLAELDRHFLAPDVLKRVAAFARTRGPMEGWFKGEMAYALDALAQAGQTGRWQANAPITEANRARIDFTVQTADGPLYLELKAMQRPGAESGLGDFVAKDEAVWGDVVKMLRLPEGRGFSVLFVYPRPEAERWAGLFDTYKRRIYPISIQERTSVTDYPPELYIAKIEVERGMLS